MQNVNFFLLFECFKNNKRTRQLAKYCAKYLDNCKKLSQETKCEHGRQRSYCRIVREAKLMSLKKRNVGPIKNWSVVEAPFLKRVRCINSNLRCTPKERTP